MSAVFTYEKRLHAGDCFASLFGSITPACAHLFMNTP